MKKKAILIIILVDVIITLTISFIGIKCSTGPFSINFQISKISVNPVSDITYQDVKLFGVFGFTKLSRQQVKDILKHPDQYREVELDYDFRRINNNKNIIKNPAYFPIFNESLKNNIIAYDTDNGMDDYYIDKGTSDGCAQIILINLNGKTDSKIIQDIRKCKVTFQYTIKRKLYNINYCKTINIHEGNSIQKQKQGPESKKIYIPHIFFHNSHPITNPRDLGDLLSRKTNW